MKYSPFKSLKSLMNRMGARSRIAFGQVLLLVGVLMLAITLHLVPNEQQAATQGRAKFCEAVAVHCSTCVARGEDELLAESFAPMVARDPDVLSATIVRSNGTKVAVYRSTAGGGAQEESHILVPIWENDIRWGTVEIHFRPLTRSGIWAYLLNPQLEMLAFIISACAALFTVYLRKMLQHLDPSKVVPPRVRSALDTLAEGLLVLDNRQRIMLANQAFATLAGRSADELMGTSVAKLPWAVTAATVTPNEYPWEQVKRDGQPRRGDVMRLHDSTGVLRTFNVNCSPILGDDGKEGEKARGVLVSLDDVTVLEQKEQELRISRDAAENANQAKSEFLARMSHEIRTPMNAILGFADVLRRGYEDSEAERQEFLDTIHSSGQHLLELINDILDLSKIESGKLEVEMLRCSPHQIISEVVAVLGTRAGDKGITLSMEWDGPAPETILTDPTRFRQVLTNLTGNALKFTEKGGVRLRARVDQSPERPRLVVDVIDSGIGMKPESLAKIFDPFTQADTSITRRFGGTGLGLSISRQCATALGGDLTVSSVYGLGSTFTLTIDAGPMEAIKLFNPQMQPAPSRSATAGSTVRPKPARVLVVEDGSSNQRLISTVLHRAGMSLEMADNGQIGFDKAMAEPFDVILMDMQMPVMDGFTATAKLREMGNKLPIVALTANAMKGEEEKCRAAGCSHYLTKPINVDLLLRTLADIVGELPPGAGPAPVAEVRKATMPANTARKSSDPPTLESTLPIDDPDFLEVVQEFAERLHDQLGKMQEAWEQKELGQLASLAHWLKGSGGTAGFPIFTDPAAKLEKLAKDQQIDEIGVALADVCDLGRRVSRPKGRGVVSGEHV